MSPAEAKEILDGVREVLDQLNKGYRADEVLDQLVDYLRECEVV